jgi:hypothetical protein
MVADAPGIPFSDYYTLVNNGENVRKMLGNPPGKLTVGP